MNDERFDELLADAIGGELSGSDAAEFEAALQDSPARREEFESLRRAAGAMASVPGPVVVPMGATDEVGRPAVSISQAALSLKTGSSGPSSHSPPRVRGGGVMRTAASVLIAFTAGYGTHAWLTIRDAVERADPSDRTVRVADAGAESIRERLTREHLAKPHRSALASCLIATSKR